MLSGGFFVTRNAAVAALLLACSVALTTIPASADTKITVVGSTALLPLAKDAAGVYQQQHPEVKIDVSGGGSGTGINQAVAKGADIGDSDILAPDHPELKDNRVAVVGFAVIVNPSAGVKNLSLKQLRDIYASKVTNWKDVGGADQKIVAFNRPRGSGTRVVFERTVIAPEKVDESFQEEDATGTIVATIKQTPGAVSYAAFSGIKSQTGIVPASLDGVAPNDANVISGKYPFWSYEHMFTYGPPTPEVAKFIQFVSGNSDLLKNNGFIKISEMKVSESNR
jgi:phosphate transport system substrate-binding protein